MFFDSHCHLHNEKFDRSRHEVLLSMKKNRVTRAVTIGCDIDSSRRAQALTQVHDELYSSAGIHPHEAQHVDSHYLSELATILAGPKVVAVGECGLDYYYEHSDRERQKRVFKEQLELASQVNMPVVIHVRDAWDDALAILKIAAKGIRNISGILHCFTGSQKEADACLDLGLHISIPGIITFKNAGELRDVVRCIPDERLLIETDAPYLAPVPYRGKRNEPGFIHATAEHVAQLRGVSLEELATLTDTNAKRLFNM